MGTVKCHVCPHHCALREGKVGRCRARMCIDSEVKCINYGKITSIALDPIEKKPLNFFYPGSQILSIGSFGCNLACPFCQNHEIAAAGEREARYARDMTPGEICKIAEELVPQGNIGVAYTYNEALVGYEFVRDTAKLVHEAGMKNVLVTNGTAELAILEEILPYIDAMNIDLKAFDPKIYEWLGGNLLTVQRFIKRAAQESHVEITSLIVPGKNESPDDMDMEAAWIAEIDPDIPLHITRYFPRHKMSAPPTSITLMRVLKEVAERHLHRVLLGNV